MIKKEFFTNDSFKFKVNKNPGQQQDVLLEFCLPYAELKHIVEGLVHDSSILQLEYPVQDNKLQICIPEESKQSSEPLRSVTVLQMDTYEAAHTLNVDFQFKSAGIAAQFFGRAQHFKAALREFHWLDDSEVL